MTTVAPAKPAKSNEWYTPAKYVEAACEVMGSIDLDPASCALANETVKATRYFTKDDDGLSQAWNARAVWMNPPFGKGNGSLDTWISKLISEYEAGNVAEAVVLVPGSIHTPWFHRLWAYPICFAYRRVRFVRPHEDQCQSNLYGNVFVYLGPNEDRFISTFSQFGTVARRIAP